MKLWIATRQYQITEALAYITRFETRSIWRFTASPEIIEEEYNEDDSLCQFTIGAIFPK